MSTETHAHAHAAPTGFWRKYVFSLDHKVIGIQYYLLGLVAVFVGMFLSILMRINLAWPNMELPWLLGGTMTPEKYLALMTMHGTIMVFFVLTTAPQSGFGNYFLPIQIGAADMAFPTLNMLSFWFTFVSFVVMLAAFFVIGGAPISGWTGYAPLSAVGEIAGPGLGTGQTLWIVSLAIFCGASLMGALNFITTTIDLRAKGMSLMRMPLTVWAWFITAILALLGFAVLLSAGLLLILDRTAGTSFFIPGGLVISDQQIPHQGGSPLLWQHLFWFFGHPEVYIAILPGMGVVSQILSTFARKPIFGYRAMVYAMFGIAGLGLVVWGHHMFMSGMSPYTAMAFSVLTMSIGVPSAIKTFNWIGTLWGGRIRFTTSMLFAIGFVSLFVTGGLSGLFLAQPAIDLFFQDTYFVVAHFHMIMGVAAIFGIFTGTYFWFPKMFGRFLHEGLGKVHFWFTLVGVYAIFMPMHFIGMSGHPRRYPDSTGANFLAELLPVHEFMSIAAFITIGAQLIFLLNFFWSLKKGKKAGENPWDSTTLEWTIPSPPPHDNFGGKVPTVYRGAYDYSVPGAPKDFIRQDIPLKMANAFAHVGAVLEEPRTGGPRGPGDSPAPGGGVDLDRRRIASGTGILLALAAIVMFFMALTSALLVRKGTGDDWVGIQVPGILWVNTLILVLSSACLEVGRRRKETGRRWLHAATYLGIAFLAGQLVAWKQLAAQGVFLSTSPGASFFYVLTAAHGVHLVGGVAGLLYAGTARARGGNALGVATTYWHFMGGLWIYLLLLLRLGG